MQKKMQDFVTQDEYKVTVQNVKSLTGDMKEAQTEIHMIWEELNKLKDKF